MLVWLASIKDLKEFKLQKTIDNYYMEIKNNKLFLSYRKKDLLINSIIIGEQTYVKSNRYYTVDYKSITLTTYKEILEKNKNLIKIDANLIIDLVNKFAKRNFDILIFKLKHKCYLNLITLNYYYIFRFKDNNFKLIKKFKLWYNLAVDEKNNLYFINSIMQIYKVSKSFKGYNEIVNFVNKNYHGYYYDFQKYFYNNFCSTRRQYIYTVRSITYKFSYKKNIVNFKLKSIDLDNDVFIDISNEILLKRSFKYRSKYFHYTYYFYATFVL